MKLKLAPAMLALLMISTSVTAAQFRAIGPRALSMGSAGVAWPEGAYASYYNPAALALNDRTEIGLTFGISTRDTGLIKPLDRLVDLDVDWDEATKDPAGPDAGQILYELSLIDEKDGLLIMPGGAFGIKWRSFGLGIYPSAEIGFYSDLDTTHVHQSDPLVDPNSFFYNTSALYAQGLGLGEVSFAYGHAFKRQNGDLICVGGAAKFIEGLTYDAVGKMTLGEEGLEERLENSDEFSASFGLDLGLLYSATKGEWSAGLLVRNINGPQFDTVRHRSLKEDMQIRAGAAYSFTKSLYGAFDIDVTDNDTAIKGVTARQVGGGLCWQATGGISLRAGVQMAISDVQSQPLFCIGGSLGWQEFNIDLAAAIPTEWQEIDGMSLPTEGGAILALNSWW